MFDIGWTEIIVIIIVGCLVLDFKDIPGILQSLKQLVKKYNDFTKEIKDIFKEIDQETKSVTRTITDLEGNEHIAYDLDDIMPDLKKDIKEQNDQPK